MDNLCINSLCNVGQIAAYQFLEPPFVAAAAQQPFERSSTGEGIDQFHVCIRILPCTRSHSSSLVEYAASYESFTCTDISITTAGKDDG